MIRWMTGQGWTFVADSSLLSETLGEAKCRVSTWNVPGDLEYVELCCVPLGHEATSRARVGTECVLNWYFGAPPLRQFALIGLVTTTTDGVHANGAELCAPFCLSLMTFGIYVKVKYKSCLYQICTEVDKPGAQRPQKRPQKPQGLICTVFPMLLNVLGCQLTY